MRARNPHTQHAPYTKMEYDYLNGWIKKMATYTQISPKMVNPRDIGGNADEEVSFSFFLQLVTTGVEHSASHCSLA